MNPDIYRRYTGRSNRRVVSNLRWLASNVDVGKVTIRLPHIPDYNTAQDVERSQKRLEAMGFRVFDRFEYIMPNAG
jgi:pyruvate formate lyase activating enzyme